MGRRFTSLRTGPKLAQRLARVQLGQLSDDDLLDYLHAQARQLAFQQSELWRTMAELDRRVPGGLTDDGAAHEVAAELRISHLSAERELDRAALVHSMPPLEAALRAGEIDRVRAVILAEACADLSEGHRAKLLAAVLPDAGTRTPGQLRAKAERLAIALDPAWAERRYRESVKQRRVVCYFAQDGTVTLAGENLPVEQALAARAHVTALAKAAKRAGARASMDELRVALFTGLLTPRFVGMGQLEVIDELVKQFPPPDAEPAEPVEPTGPTPSAVAFGVELRVGLATLMGLSEEPGEIVGAGPVIAPVARELAELQRRGQWRYAVVDQHGRLLHDGITRHRPTGYEEGGGKGGIVELHVPTYLLDPAFGEEHPQWAKLLTDIAQQYAAKAPIEQDPAARLPGDRLRRRVEIKHRNCVFPGCRRPATDSQLDHRHDWAKRGPTTETNLGPLCQRHHTLKTKAGWRLSKQSEIDYLWISPLGRRHHVEIEPVAPPHTTAA